MPRLQRMWAVRSIHRLATKHREEWERRMGQTMDSLSKATG